MGAQLFNLGRFAEAIDRNRLLPFAEVILRAQPVQACGWRRSFRRSRQQQYRQ